MTSSYKKEYLPLLLIILFGVLIRFYGITQPILEGAISKQIHTADVTRYIYNSDFDFLFLNFNNTDRPHTFPMEFPLYNIAVALLYKLFGMHDFLGRVVSILSFGGGAFFLYRLSRKFYGNETAQYATIFFVFSPLSIIYTRSFQPDALMIFFNVSFFYFLSEWLDSEKTSHFIISWILATLLFLNKQSSMYLFLPAIFLAYLRLGNKIFFKKEIYFLVLSVLPALIWTHHAVNLSSMNYSIKAEVWNLGGWLHPDLWFNYLFYKDIFEIESGLVMTSVGFALFLLGLTLKNNQKEERFFQFWLLATIVFFFAFPFHAHTHLYYHLPMIPVAAIFIGKGAYSIAESKISENSYLKENRILKIIFSLIIGIMVFGYSNSGFKIPPNVASIPSAGNAVKNLTEKNALVVLNRFPRVLQYYCQRRGWDFYFDKENIRNAIRLLENDNEIEPTPENYIEVLRKHGADYYVDSSPINLFSQEKFGLYMVQNYEILKHEKGRYIIFDIREKLILPVENA